MGIAPLVVALLLTPFIIGRLGAERYGVLTLMLSVSGYLGLADMGIGVSIGRYVNLYMARREGDKVNHVINSAIPFFVLAGLVLVGAASVLSMYLGRVFPAIPPAHLWEAKLLLTLAALDVMLQFLVNAVVSIPIAHERFDIRNGLLLTTTLLRAGATWLLLSRGGGLVTMGLINIGADAVMLVGLVVASKLVDRSVRFGLRWFRWQQFRELVAFAGGAVFNLVAQKVLYFTDILLIGWFISPRTAAQEITVYSVGMSFVIYGRGFLLEIARTFYPLMAKQGHGTTWRRRGTSRRHGADHHALHDPADGGLCDAWARLHLQLAGRPRAGRRAVPSGGAGADGAGRGAGGVDVVGIVAVDARLAGAYLAGGRVRSDRGGSERRAEHCVHDGHGPGDYGRGLGDGDPGDVGVRAGGAAAGCAAGGRAQRDLLRARWSWLLAMSACCVVGFVVARVPVSDGWAGKWAIWSARAAVAAVAMWVVCWFFVDGSRDRRTIEGVFRAGAIRVWNVLRGTTAPAGPDAEAPEKEKLSV